MQYRQRKEGEELIDVKSEVPIYEEGGTDTLFPHPVARVASHDFDDSRVILHLPGRDKSITVLAADLLAAIKNATNSNRVG